jgi:hypothetical protein
MAVTFMLTVDMIVAAVFPQSDGPAFMPLDHRARGLFFSPSRPCVSKDRASAAAIGKIMCWMHLGVTLHGSAPPLPQLFPSFPSASYGEKYLGRAMVPFFAWCMLCCRWPC